MRALRRSFSSIWRLFKELAVTHRTGLVLIAALLLAGALSVAAQERSVDAGRGFGLMFDQRGGNCAACHSIPDASGKKSGVQSNFAPPLDGVASRYSAAQLLQWVVDARKINPPTLMPPFGLDLNTDKAKGRLLTDAQIADVVAALQTLR
jgi:sulfur-oxidizing protein SoxX